MNLTKGFLSYSAFQGNQEKLIDYYRRLKVKAADCGLNNEDAEIRTQIIQRTRDACLRKKALREPC